MRIVLQDGAAHQALLPMTYTRPVSELRLGISSLREKWEAITGQTIRCYATVPHLEEQFPPAEEGEDDTLVVAAALIARPRIWGALEKLQRGQCLWFDNRWLGYRAGGVLEPTELPSLESVLFAEEEPTFLDHPWQLFAFNGDAIAADLLHNSLVEGGDRPEETPHLRIAGRYPVVVHPQAQMESAALNATEGPIYIGPYAHVMEGSLIRGPFAMCEHATLKMGTKVYGQTTLGPYCKAGGELNNVLMTGFANKGHDGFLGNAVIGAWCNLGADTNNSNLKNNYSEVRMWSYAQESFELTGRQFAGLVMGDHCKTGINSMLNTGTVVGVACNLFGGDFPPKFVPSFSWGGAQHLRTYQLEKALDTAQRMMERRGLQLLPPERRALEAVYRMSAPYRSRYMQ